MDYGKLKNEITTDPLARGYASMTNQQVADNLNTVYRTLPVESVTGQDIFEAVVQADYAALTAAQKELLYAIVGMGTIRVNGANTTAALLAMFPSGSTTRANLAALRTRPVSRAEELGLPRVDDEHIRSARMI